jgi:hypothetical protein
LLLEDAPCTNRSSHRCYPHFSEQGRNEGAKARADACPESVLSATPCRWLTFLDAKKPFFGKMEVRPKPFTKGTVSFVHSMYHGPTLSDQTETIAVWG